MARLSLSCRRRWLPGPLVIMPMSSGRFERQADWNVRLIRTSG
ncbi:hypothetical protein DDI_2487 [Dickeya dianthicola RNS04.9]|nr:hypothetical protein DDI_2487 [Dickeya dianthicola RNS04.9]